MPSRITQDVRSVPIATGAAGGAARITQAVRAAVIDEGTPKAGGAARATQLVRVVIATVPRRGVNILTAPVGRIRKLNL